MEARSNERREIDPRPQTRSTTAKPIIVSKLREAKKKLMERPQPNRHPTGGKGL